MVQLWDHLCYVANLFMEHFEIYALQTTPDYPNLWYKYVDHTFVIINQSKVNSFTMHINSIHPCIKFTTEKEEDRKLAFLDTLVQRWDDGSLKVTVYRKSTYTNQYLHFDFFFIRYSGN